MRVLHVISCLVKADGHSLFCMTLAERLSSQGSAQRVFTLPSQGGEPLPDPKQLVQYSNARLFRFLNIVWPLGIKRQLTELTRLFKPDVIHLHGGWHPVLFFAVRVAKRMGCPILLSLHGSLRPAVVEGDRRMKKRVAWWLYQRRLVEMADMIHVSTETERGDLVRLGFDKPVVVVPNGVDSETFARTNELPRDAACTRTVLYLGRLHPLKGLDLLIPAWARVRSSKVLKCESAKVGEGGGRSAKVLKCESAKVGEGGGRSALMCDGESALVEEDVTDNRACPENSRTLELQNFRTSPWQLVIAGPEENGLTSKLIAQAEKLGLRVEDKHSGSVEHNEKHSANAERVGAHYAPSPDIIFTGPLYGEEKTKAMAAADLFVLPTRSENFGIVVAEALACGVPVITTKGAPWQELLGSPACSKVLKCESAKVGGGTTANGANPANEDNFSTLEFSNFRTSRCGWWVDVGVEPLVEALREAMSLTDEERHAMGENGRALVERKFKWESVSGEIMKAYAHVH